MRILAIRGCNLASLAGEFEIDLAHGPLGAAGVFAIVGNTGAGKSTLLDALCVALFDRTPRLTNHSRVQVGRGEDDPGALGAQDVRTLLRRGAASGWAEVDFESGDARRYRARWSVRRARGHADGTIQSQQVSLTTLDGGERIGGTKTETLDEIRARLGLSFDQFRRSALLAQGEFAAFLRADGKDRSELLERMTGTEIYTRLSVAAHLRATLAANELATGRAAALAIGVLDEDARVAAEAELVLAEEAKVAARARFATAEIAARWVAEAEQRGSGLRAAEAAYAEAVQAVADAEIDRAELALRRRAEALRGPWEEAARIDRQLAIAQGDVSAALDAETQASLARTALEAARAELDGLQAPVRAARIAAQLVERTAPMRGDARTLARAAVDDAAWLIERAALAPEIAAWNDLDAKFAQHAAAADAITSIDRAIAEHAESHGKLAGTRADAAGELQGASAKHAEAVRKTDSFQKRRGLTLEAARKQEDEARVRKAEVEGLIAIAAAARSTRLARDEIDRRLAELASTAAVDATAHTAAETLRATALIVRGERARVVEELRMAAGYEHARTELVEGEPCPLCGAEEHPWRDRGSLDELVASATTQLADVMAQVEGATTTIATLDARADQRVVVTQQLGKSRATAVASADDAVVKWSEQISAIGELSLVRDPMSADAEQLADELMAAATKRLESARATRSQTEAATKAAAEAHAEVQLYQTNVDHVTARLAELDRRIGELDTKIGLLHGERTGRVERHGELVAEVDAAIARWTSAVPPPKQPRRTSPKRDEREIRRAWMAELAAEWRTRADRVAVADAALTVAIAQADREARDAERAVAEHASRCVEIENRRDALIAELSTAVAALDAVREGSGFDVEELRRLLSADPARVDELVEKLSRIELAVARERAIVGERSRLVSDHAAARPVSIPGVGVKSPPSNSGAEPADTAAITELAAQVAMAEEHAARLAAMLAADTDARGKRAAALALLAIAEGAAHVDRILGEVIGSHDGKLFRSFAQSLTLDGLLSVANSHLEELAPRYQLERVPKHDLELQVVDRDLGHEVRSVQSLSGGESFLVSLALALGLSSMSAHDVRVRTLLIDEGFGTLDPTTLEMALSVLEALRQQGRQVGVISHVQGITERLGAHVRVVARGGGRSEVIVA